MTQYINKEPLVVDITNLKVKYECGWNCAIDKVLELIDNFEVKEDIEHYELEEFARIVRGNLTSIDKNVQALFEAKYQQLTGNKMYGGYKD